MFPYFHIFGFEFSIYFLVLSVVFTAAVPIVVKRAKRLSFSPVKALDIYLFVLVGAFLGSRGLYVLYQEPGFYFQNPMQILYFWNGGYIFFGGLFGGVLSGYICCLWQNEEPELWINFAIPLLSLGYAVGRGACLLSGCCYGRESSAWWAVFMHQAYRHPTQLYAMSMEAFILLILFLIEKKKGFEAFLVFPVWLILHGAGRVLMEYFRDDPRGGEIFGLSISTNISIGLVLVGMVLLWKKKL